MSSSARHHHRPPPPPPPPPGGGGGGGYYSSNAGTSSSTAARQRLGLSGTTPANTTYTTASTTNNYSAPSRPAANNTSGGGVVGNASSENDWFASSSSSSANPAPAAAPPVAMAPTAGSGFYSTSGYAADTNRSNGFGGANNQAYGNVNAAPSSYGAVGTSSGPAGSGGNTFYGNGGTSTGGGYNNFSNASRSSGVGGAVVPPSAATYGSHSNPQMMGGPIGSSTPAMPSPSTAPSVFDPSKQQTNNNNNNNNNAINNTDTEDYENEPPLLEELGVNFPHIYAKSRAVLFPIGSHAKSLEASVMEDTDLAGPLAFALGLGGELLLSGKMHFGYVYGFVVSGSIAMTLLLNLLNPNGAVSMWMVVSILGYALLPVNLLAGLNAVVKVARLGWGGMVMAVLVIGWCTMASTRLFERACGMRDQRYLVAYPVALLYSAFVMITIF